MSKTITATFDSIDAATIAASNTKDHCTNVEGVKIKYKQNHGDHEPYLFSGAFTPVEASVPSVLQNGLYPVAVNVDALGQYNPYPTKSSKVKVEIVASGANVSPICSTLRQAGGISVKVK